MVVEKKNKFKQRREGENIALLHLQQHHQMGQQQTHACKNLNIPNGNTKTLQNNEDVHRRYELTNPKYNSTVVSSFPLCQEGLTLEGEAMEEDGNKEENGQHISCQESFEEEREKG